MPMARLRYMRPQEELEYSHDGSTLPPKTIKDKINQAVSRDTLSTYAVFRCL